MIRLLSALIVLAAANAAFADRVSFEGEMQEGALLIGTTEPDARVYVGDQRVRVSPAGKFLLGFHRKENKLQVRVEFADGASEKVTLTVPKREYRVQRIDGLKRKHVSPDEEALKRIRKENAQARKARARDDARTDFLAGFIWPTVGPISGVYGSQRILNGQPRRPHYGVDVAVPTGTPVRAPAGGIVTLAHPDMYFSGGTMILDHGHGLTSSFLHLSRILVAEGQRVAQGDVIAEVGATGRVTGAHLDWRMNLKKRRLDPVLIAGPMPSQ